MNLLVVTHFYASHGGGIEIVAEHLIRALSLRGHRVTWAASDVTDAPSDIDGLTPLPMAAWNFAEDRLGFPYPLWSPASLKRLAAAVDAADVVHLHDSLYFGNVGAFLLARLEPKPVLVTQHISEVPYSSPVLRVLMTAANATVARFVLTGADQVVFIADQVRMFFERRFDFRAPPLLIMNGVDTARFRPGNSIERAALRRELALVDERPTFVFVGRFVEKKGLHLLRAFAGALPMVDWLFAGMGPLDPSAWELPNVRVLGRCDPQALRKLYVAADLLVLPSVGEGFPLVVQEAMACGTPALVATETARGCPMAGALLMHAAVDNDPTARATWLCRLEELIDRRDTLTAMRPAVARFAHDQWSWDRAALGYETAFQRLARDRSTAIDRKHAHEERREHDLKAHDDRDRGRNHDA